MNYTQLKSYFQEIAESHQDLQHSSTNQRFYTLGIKEMLQSSSDLPGDGYVLNYETPESDFSGGSDDFPMKERTAAFSILRKVENGDAVDMAEALDECEQIGDEVIRKINQDSNDARMGEDDLGEIAALIEDFDLRGVRSFPIGPILNNFFGVRYEFTLATEFSTQITEEKWQ